MFHEISLECRKSDVKELEGHAGRPSELGKSVRSSERAIGARLGLQLDSPSNLASLDSSDRDIVHDNKVNKD